MFTVIILMELTEVDVCEGVEDENDFMFRHVRRSSAFVHKAQEKKEEKQ